MTIVTPAQAGVQEGIASDVSSFHLPFMLAVGVNVKSIVERM